MYVAMTLLFAGADGGGVDRVSGADCGGVARLDAVDVFVRLIGSSITAFTSSSSYSSSARVAAGAGFFFSGVGSAGESSNDRT